MIVKPYLSFLMTTAIFFSIFGDTHETSVDHQENIEEQQDESSLDDNPLVPADIEAFARTIEKELDMQQCNIQYRCMSVNELRNGDKQNAYADFENQTVTIDIAWFRTLSTEEQRILIGHELIHLKQQHSCKQEKFDTIAMVTCFLLYYICIEQLAKKYSFFKKWLAYKKEASENKSTEEAKEFILMIERNLSKFLAAPFMLWYSRRCEREADILAAKKLNCARGGVMLWERFMCECQADETDQTSTVRKIWRRIKNLSLFSTHPSNKERRDYLFKISCKQTPNIII